MSFKTPAWRNARSGQSAARPGGCGATACQTPISSRRSRQSCLVLSNRFLHLTAIFFGGVLAPPYSPSRSPALSAGLPPEIHPRRLFCDQNFDQFLTSIFYRFWAVLGCHLGVIFGTFGGQVAPSSVQNASWKLINVKNVNFQQILGIPIPERYFRAQDGLRNAPSSAQDGSKRLLESNFLAFENPFKF